MVYESEHGVHLQVHPGLAEKETIPPVGSEGCHVSFWLTRGESVFKGTHFWSGFFSVRIQKCRTDPSVEEDSPEADKNFEVINGVTHISSAFTATPLRPHDEGS